MNYSDTELLTSRTNEESLVDAGVELLPLLSKALFSAISILGQTHGLTPAQVKVLLQLGNHRQKTVGEIGAAVGCSLPAASELVDRLVDAGHLVRASDPADRRRVLVAATPESERISSDLHQLRRAQIRHALDQLPLEDRPIFIKSLEALVAGLRFPEETMSPPTCGAPPVNESQCHEVAPAELVPAAPDATSPLYTADRESISARLLRSTAR